MSDDSCRPRTLLVDITPSWWMRDKANDPTVIARIEHAIGRHSFFRLTYGSRVDVEVEEGGEERAAKMREIVEAVRVDTPNIDDAARGRVGKLAAIIAGEGA